MAIDLVEELTRLRRRILSMGASVEGRVREAVSALLEHDHDRAAKVRHGDREINDMEVDIEEECLKVLALSHPVAGDLRFVLAVMRINTSLERIADHAKSIAKRVLDLEDQGYHDIPDPIRRMADETLAMLDGAITALADENPDLARRVRRSDDRVDDLQKEVFAWARSEIPHHVENTEAAIDFLSIARTFERIADVSTNIAEEVIFLSEGALVRHKHT